MNITGIILSGGKSTRMGADKGLLTFQGKPMIESVINHIQPLCSQIIISANSKEYKKFGFKVIADVFENIGPVAGILSTFPQAVNNRIILISCDLPNASTQLLEKLLLLADNYDITLPVPEGIIQPLCGIYSRNIVNQMHSHVQKGETKLKNLVKKFNLRIIESKDIAEFDLKTELANMNSKTDILRFK